MLLGRKPIGTVAYLGGLMSLPEPFCWSFSQLVQYNTEYVCEANERVHYERATISFHAAARNDLVSRLHGDWLLMLDTDITFEPDLLARMLRVMNDPSIAVLVALYQHKAPPYAPVLYMDAEDGEHFQVLGRWDVPSDQPYVIPVASAGAGALLVRRSVYERIRDELREQPFDILPPFGEDHSFFKRLKRLGIQAYCDPAIQVQHLMMKGLTLADYDMSDAVFGAQQLIGG